MHIVAILLIIAAVVFLGPHLKNIIGAVLAIAAIYFVGSAGLALLGGAVALGPIIIGAVVFFFIRGIFFD